MSDIAKETGVQTTPQQVTLFEDRAEVQRLARLAVPAGVSTVDLLGVSAAIDDPSLVARLRGPAEGARILSTQVLRRVREAPALSEGELAAAEEDRRAARGRREELELRLGRARGRLGRGDALVETWLRAVARVPRRRLGAAQGDAAPGAKAPGWLQAHGAIDGEISAALDEVSALEQALLAAREDEARAELRLSEGRRLTPRHETLVRVQLEARAPLAAELELVYRTPLALWRPEHVARLSRKEGGGHELRWTVLATCWQRTGEEWRGVAGRFSTARPGKAASPPLLGDDVLLTRRKSEVERRQVVVEAREQAIAASGLGHGGRQAEEMPGVEDGGEPLTFSGAEPLSLPSDGQPCRVELLSFTLPCEVDLVGYPERSEAVHLRATATLTGGTPILAGPVRLLREDETVGAGRIGFVARGEPFELGFGVDDGLRVRRQLETQRDTGLLGAQKVAITVRLFVGNLGGAPRRLSLTERLPVSEIEDLRVALTQNPGGRLDERDGFLRLDLELPPGGEKELVLGYRIEASSRVHLPF